MRPHGHGTIDPSRPAARAVCQRCGFIFAHSDLAWQHQWAGSKLQNLRLLVCPDCLDMPQEQLRTYILPADPVPITNPRPEDFVGANNPVSGLGWDPAELFTGTRNGTSVGSLDNVEAAFFGGDNKPRAMSAQAAVSVFGYFNWVGKNWAAEASGQEAPQLTHIAARFTATAPNDSPFLSSGSTGWRFEGSTNGIVWVTLAQGTTTGTAGEIIATTIADSVSYQYHRFVVSGDGINPIGIAKLDIYISDANAIQG